eukprot:TRINITY_DN26493_c0_g1_i1.p2 TRINITY_DN26493_c0_g1~~TRINITY_DN26493_c0_g1_i1.p2  ORF type:complete len:114 (-),score=6.23 TRINITY_DN26493_c0_g1_i1:387-728(-)
MLVSMLSLLDAFNKNAYAYKVTTVWNYKTVRTCSTRVNFVTGPSGLLSPAGSSGASLTNTFFTTPSSTTRTKRLHRPFPKAVSTFGCVIIIPIAFVNSPRVSPRKVMIEPSTF